MRLILLMPLASLRKWYLTLMCFVFIDVLCFPVLDWIFGNCNCQLAFKIQHSGFLLNFTHVDDNFSSSYCFICCCTCCNALKFHVDWATISYFLWKPWKYSISKKKKYNRMYFSYHPMNQPNHYQCSQTILHFQLTYTKCQNQ